jgi:hypothetical protein
MAEPGFEGLEKRIGVGKGPVSPAIPVPATLAIDAVESANLTLFRE